METRPHGGAAAAGPGPAALNGSERLRTAPNSSAGLREPPGAAARSPHCRCQGLAAPGRSLRGPAARRTGCAASSAGSGLGPAPGAPGHSSLLSAAGSPPSPSTGSGYTARHLCAFEKPFVLRKCKKHSSKGAEDAFSLAPVQRRVPASANEMDGTLSAVAEELLKEIKKAFQETSHVPDDLLLGLKFIFGSSAVPALDLVDQRSVTRVTSPSGRTAYQVLGSSGKLYTCYSSCHFCTCPAFGFTVLQKSESLLCKHILAVYLSQAMGACQELTVSEEQLTSILLAEEGDEG